MDTMFIIIHQLFLHLLGDSLVRIEILMVSHAFHLGIRTEQILLFRIFIGKSVRAGKLILTAVRTRSHHVMLDEDGLSVLSRYHGEGVVSVLEVITFFSGHLFHHPWSCHGLGVHRNQGLHPVTTMDIEKLTSRAKTMRRIYIPAIILVVKKPPVLPILIPELFKIMDIGTFNMEDLPKKSVLSHIQGSEFEEIIDAILKLHAMFSCAFRGIYQLPYLINRHRSRHLYSRMLAVFHCIDTHRRMTFPVCDNIDQIHLIALAQPLPCIFSDKLQRSRFSCLLKSPLAPVNLILSYITQGSDLGSRNMGKTVNGAYTTHSQSYDTYTDRIHRFTGKTHHIFLTGRA